MRRNVRSNKKQETSSVFPHVRAFSFPWTLPDLPSKRRQECLKQNNELIMSHTHIHTHHTFLGKSSLPLGELIHGLTVKSFT